MIVREGSIQAEIPRIEIAEPGIPASHRLPVLALLDTSLIQVENLSV